MTCKSRFPYFIVLVFLTILFACAPPTEYAPTPVEPIEPGKPAGLKRFISVLDFENRSGHGGPEIGSGFSDRLVSALMEHDAFILLERQRLADLQDEAALGQSGALTPESAVRIGQKTGAQAIIIARISDFDLEMMEQDFGDLFDFDLAVQLFRAKVTVHYRIVDVATGTVITGKRVSLQRTKPAVGFEIEDYAFSNLEEIDNTLLGSVSAEVVSALAEEIMSQHSRIPWHGKVIDIRDDIIYFTPGKNCGITAGMPFKILPSADERRKPVPITVSGFVGEKVSKAVLPDGTVFAIGDRVVK